MRRNRNLAKPFRSGTDNAGAKDGAGLAPGTFLHLCHSWWAGEPVPPSGEPASGD